ncbi:MAG: hypothetical protein JSV99_06520 [Planctomycetota bacterium]|nr:MAG: hypothetical protein JSV99_06520 [Planctomycetota bacterium]
MFQASVKHVCGRQGKEECLRTNKCDVRIDSGRIPCRFDRSFCEEPEAVDFLEQIDARINEGQILKGGDTSYVSRVIWGGKDIVIKRHNHKGFIHSVRHTIKKSRVPFEDGYTATCSAILIHLFVVFLVIA